MSRYMPTTNLQPILQALVRTLRANATLKAAVAGFWEGSAPAGTTYPYVTYHHAGGGDYWEFGSVTKKPVVAIQVWSSDQVEARNLDQLIINTLWDAELSIEQQSTLLCRREGDISDANPDGTGQKVYQVGGYYRIWSDIVL
jgi:hypothetical protein